MTTTTIATHDILATERRLGVDEVIRMAEAGIIARRERVELIDGRLVQMSPEGLAHAKVVRALNTRLARLYPERFEVGSQTTLPLSADSYLEPDVLVLHPRDEDWRWPAVDEVVLVVEVALTSARRDRTQKAALYAAWGAPVYWIVDLNLREVVVHTDPGPEGYANITTLTGGAVELPEIGGAITIADVLPPA